MDWNDILTLVIAIDTIVKLPALPVGGYFLWRWWQRRSRAEPGTFTVPTEQIVQIDGNGVGLSTTGEELDIRWVGYGEREPE